MFRCYSYTMIRERINLCLLKLQLIKQSIKIHRCVVNTVVVWLHILGHRVYLHKPRQYSITYYTPKLYSLLLLGYKPVQHVTVLNTVGNCNTVVSIIILLSYGTTVVYAVRCWSKRRYSAHTCTFNCTQRPTQPPV